MSLIIRPSQYVMEQAAKAVALVAPAVVPIFRSDPRNNPDFEGSGILLQVGGRYVLVSAAQVFDQCAQGTYLLLQGDEQSALKGDILKTVVPAGKTRAADRIDIGFQVLLDDEVERLGPEHFLAPSDLSPMDAHARKAQYIALGFPGKLQERVYTDSVYRVQGAYYVTTAAGPKGYQNCKLERDSHFLLRYAKNKVVSMSGEGVPSFRGMSGGGVWRFNALEQQRPDNRPKLIAVVIEQPECYGKSILTTRIELLLAGLRTRFPELERDIPPSRALSVNVRFE